VLFYPESYQKKSVFLTFGLKCFESCFFILKVIGKNQFFFGDLKINKIKRKKLYNKKQNEEERRSISHYGRRNKK